MIRHIMQGGDFLPLIGNRKLYIWGSGHLGVSIRYAMSRIGVEVAGFLDSNMAGSQFLGFPVENPDDVLREGKHKVFIIISSFLFADEMVKRCNEFAFSAAEDYLTHADIAPNFEIDVAGCCNLRCLTCPRGNAPSAPDVGMMSLANYKKVLDKLAREIPILGDVQLYSWGEPLLNPELPEIIAYTASKGLATAVSSNLSLQCNLESVVKSSPTWFRVSLSGSNAKTYSVIHRAGKLDVVIKNLRRLSQLRTRFAPNMFVELNYHLYKHNLDGVEQMAGACRELGFVFRTSCAYIDPLDSIIKYAQGMPLPKRMEEGRQFLLLDIDEAIGFSRQCQSSDCVSENCFVIHSDLSFRRCNHLYQDRSNIIANNFLDTPLEEVLRRARTCEICHTCRSLGVHRFHFAYADRKLEPENIRK